MLLMFTAWLTTSHAGCTIHHQSSQLRSAAHTRSHPHPTHSPTCASASQRVLRAEWAPLPGVFVSEDVWQLMRACLAADPAARPSMSDLLSHPWFLMDLPEGGLTVSRLWWCLRRCVAAPN